MRYFLHGYQSSPNGEKAALFKETLQAFPIAYRSGSPEDLVISKALQQISHAIHQDNEVVLIGSSLGGFLAASFALTHPVVRSLVLLNPAIIPPETDLRTIKGIPLRILKEMQNPELFTKRIPATITILRATHDDVVPDQWVHRFADAHHATIQYYDDDHRFSKNLQKLPTIISTILQK
jgi:predicted esterase YcpF (UPF0227 family)